MPQLPRPHPLLYVLLAALLATGFLAGCGGEGPEPEEAAAPAAAATRAASSSTVYYRLPTGWSAARIRYAPLGGTWTASPGVAMTAACAGWVKRTVALGSAQGLTAAFNDGAGHWDSNGGRNYRLGLGEVTVAAGVVGKGNPCRDTTPPSAPTAWASCDASGAHLTWWASSDDVGVAGYRITRTGGSQGTVVAQVGADVTSYLEPSLDPGATYSWVVVAFDAAGNLSAASAPATLTIPASPGALPAFAITPDGGTFAAYSVVVSITPSSYVPPLPTFSYAVAGKTGLCSGPCSVDVPLAAGEARYLTVTACNAAGCLTRTSAPYYQGALP